MKRLLTFFILLLLVASCTKEVDVSQGDTSREIVSFTASVVDMSQTKATLISSWSGGEEVAIFAGDDLYHYTIAEDGSMSGDDVTVDNDDSELTYTAFYPYNSELTTIDEYEAACTAGSIDYMRAVTQSTGNTVELQFSHQMAALSFSLMTDKTVTFTNISLTLFVDGEISTVDLELDANIGSAASKYESNYFVAGGSDISSAFIKIDCDGSSTIHSIKREDDTNTLVAGNQYPFSYTMDDILTGSGTEDDPYIIYFADDMRKVGTGTDGWSLSSYYKLALDIDLESVEFTAIGLSSSSNFTGSFDGDGNTISGLYINKPSTKYQGLFGYISGATIKNLSVSGDIIGNSHTGGIVGYATSNATISNCNYTGSVEGTSERIGGIVGYAYSASISYCNYTGSVENDSFYTGGIVGYATSSTISNCNNSGSVEGKNSGTGGVVGYTESGTTENCYNTGSVEGKNSGTGGVVGNTESGTTENCYNTGSVEGGSSYTGGVVGYNSSSETTHCYNTGSVEGSYYVGGVAGGSSADGKIESCYNANTVSSTGYGGGVVGVSGSCSYLFYDKEVATSVSKAVYDMNDKDKNYCGLTTDNMKGDAETDGTLLYYLTNESYGNSSEWEADTNNINNGYPVLSWQNQEIN